ncbi:unnamed protein product, partial [marine sediment metagenome]
KANFPDAQMNVTVFYTKDYGNKSNWKLGENKPNTKPNKANFRKAEMNVNYYSTKDYENISNWKLCENKPNTKPIQSQYKPNQTQLNPCRQSGLDSSCGHWAKREKPKAPGKYFWALEYCLSALVS